MIFRNWVLQNFPYLEDDFDALTDYELFCKMMEYVLKLSDDNVEFRQELNNYKNYFDNLDVQEEINKKLDKMAEDGTLTLLIKQYVDPIYEAYETTVNGRLNNMDAKLLEQDTLIQTQNNAINEIDDKVNIATSGSPKGVYATVAALEAADPDHDYIYVVTADGKWYYYDSEESAWTAGGTYQSTSIGTGAIDIPELANNLKTAVNCYIPTLSWTTGYYINNGGYITSNGSYEYAEVTLKKGDKIIFDTFGTTSTTVLGSFLRYRNARQYWPITAGTGAAQTVSYTATYDGIYVLCGRTSDVGTVKIYSQNLTHNLDTVNKLGFIDTIIKTGNDDLTANKLVSGINGEFTSDTNTNEFWITDYIEVRPNTSITLEIKGKQLVEITQQFYGLAFYNPNKVFISGIRYSTDNKITTTTPVNAKYIAFTVTSNMYEGGYSLYYTSLSSMLSNYETSDKSYLDLWKSFKTVGAIGDSLASGAYSYNEGGETGFVNDFSISWPQYMAKMSGNTYYNFSWGGVTTRSWLTNSYCYPEASNPNKKCDAYIIGLGVNDANNLGTEYIGSTSDIDTSDYTNNEDTYYGNYAGIIQRMQAIQPKAVFFLLTMPRTSATYTAFNTAVRNIAAILDNCYVIDLETDYIDEFSEGSFIDNNKRNGHYNSIAYNVIAQDLARYISQYMFNNYQDFKFIEYIGTDHEYSD